MLLGIKVVQAFLKWEEVFTISAEHRDKGIVPHKDVSIVGWSDITGYKSRVI